jgi:acyl-coenzyme A thioesterase PaaI-like protein
MPESLLTRLVLRRLYNLWPCYWGTGVRLKYIAKNYREMRIELPLNWRTRNYVGTIFGGSMYGAVDPVYMLMLIKNLGSDYEVWDKAASIRFRKPGRSTLHANFTLDADEIRHIQEGVGQAGSIDRVYTIDLIDKEGTACATVEKTIHIRRRRSSGESNFLAGSELQRSA